MNVRACIVDKVKKIKPKEYKNIEHNLISYIFDYLVYYLSYVRLFSIIFLKLEYSKYY
jgi:hypothetical protein